MKIFGLCVQGHSSGLRKLLAMGNVELQIFKKCKERIVDFVCLFICILKVKKIK